MASNELLIDACVLINLFATRRFSEVLAANGAVAVVAEQVAAEALYVERGDVRAPIVVADLVGTGAIRVDMVQGNEEETLVRFAAEMDDGEAATLAIAVHRGIKVATDDRGAIRFVDRAGLGVVVLRTSDLMRSWARGRPEPEVRAVLLQIESDARFRPGPTDPNQDWWDDAVR